MADRADTAMEKRLATVEQSLARLRSAISDDASEKEPTNLRDATKKARETFRQARAADAEDAKDGGADEDTEKS